MNKNATSQAHRRAQRVRAVRRKCGKARRANTTPEERSEFARRAGQARWAKEKGKRRFE